VDVKPTAPSHGVRRAINSPPYPMKLKIEDILKAIADEAED
jgi:hypothetical protein